jgi:hypothetical protein
MRQLSRPAYLQPGLDGHGLEQRNLRMPRPFGLLSRRYRLGFARWPILGYLLKQGSQRDGFAE